MKLNILVLITVAWILTGPAFVVPAFGYISVYATDQGDSASITISLLNDYDSDYSGIVIYRRAVGICEEPVLLDTDVVPMPPPTAADRSLAVRTTVMVPLPYPNVHYEFIAKAVNASGEHVFPQDGAFYYPPGRISGFAAQGEAPLVRGILIITPSGYADTFIVNLIPCQDGCWGDVGFMELAWGVGTEHPLYREAVPGVVDVIGEFTFFNGMLGSGMPEYTGVRSAPTGACGPVPTDVTSWGELKAMYR